jgi:hypothetical protein
MGEKDHMGVPMVQTKARRRSSLIWGALLAILLGVAAAFFVLAMPIHMLETVTTATRLSKLMVQAEPPISPNDRTLLSVLAGIFIAAVGWVLLDWLLFGKAGLSAIVPTRDDDFEDEDDDAFRPTDPLDLIGGAPAPLSRQNDWSAEMAGDPRRPLSARTDIGDPPAAAAPFLPGVTDNLPPLGQILPGAGVAAPPLSPAFGASPIQPPPLFPQQPAPASAWGGDPLPAGRGSWPPLDDDTVGVPLVPPAAPSPPAEPVAKTSPVIASIMPSWLPAPGARVDDASTTGDAAEDPALSPAAPAAPAEAVAASDAGTSSPVADGDPSPILSAFPPSAAAASAPPEVFDLGVAAFAPAEPVQDQKPEVPLDLNFAPSVSAGRAHEGSAVEPLTPSFVSPEMPSVSAAPIYPLAEEPVRPAMPRAPTPGLDRARLEDLLERLERSLENRRAAAAARPPAGAGEAWAPQSPPAAAPLPVQARAVPDAAAMPSVDSARTTMPAAEGIATSFAPNPPPSVHSEAEAVPVPLSEPAPSVAPLPAQRQQYAAGAGAANDALLEQPLHLTLEQLRQMIRR